MSVQLKRWSRQEYDKMIDAGVFAAGERLELIEGEIVQMAPQNPQHATAITAAAEALRAIFGTGHTVRVQLPLALGDRSEPEPDLAVVWGHWRDFAAGHPSMAVLVVEVSDSSLEFDRVRKQRVYARAGIPEYWVINLIERVIEVYHEPRVDGYASRRIFDEASRLAPQGSRAAAIAVRDLLP